MTLLNTYNYYRRSKEIFYFQTKLIIVCESIIYLWLLTIKRHFSNLSQILFKFICKFGLNQNNIKTAIDKSCSLYYILEVKMVPRFLLVVPSMGKVGCIGVFGLIFDKKNSYHSHDGAFNVSSRIVFDYTMQLFNYNIIHYWYNSLENSFPNILTVINTLELLYLSFKLFCVCK